MTGMGRGLHEPDWELGDWHKAWVYSPHYVFESRFIVIRCMCVSVSFVRPGEESRWVRETLIFKKKKKDR